MKRFRPDSAAGGRRAVEATAGLAQSAERVEGMDDWQGRGRGRCGPASVQEVPGTDTHMTLVNVYAVVRADEHRDR